MTVSSRHWEMEANQLLHRNVSIVEFVSATKLACVLVTELGPRNGSQPPFGMAQDNVYSKREVTPSK